MCAERIFLIIACMDVHLAVRAQRAIHAVRARCDEESAWHRIERIVPFVLVACQRPYTILCVPTLNFLPVGLTIICRTGHRAIREYTAVEALQISCYRRRQGASLIRLHRAICDATRIVHAALTGVRRLPIGQNIQRAALDEACAVDAIAARRSAVDEFIVAHDIVRALEAIVHIVPLERTSRSVRLRRLCIVVGSAQTVLRTLLLALRSKGSFSRAVAMFIDIGKVQVVPCMINTRRAVVDLPCVVRADGETTLRNFAVCRDAHPIAAILRQRSSVFSNSVVGEASNFRKGTRRIARIRRLQALL